MLLVGATNNTEKNQRELMALLESKTSCISAVIEAGCISECGSSGLRVALWP